MDLVDWQQRFERWILTHHAQDDAAHDLSHFRRVWATATQLAAVAKLLAPRIAQAVARREADDNDGGCSR